MDRETKIRREERIRQEGPQGGREDVRTTLLAQALATNPDRRGGAEKPQEIQALAKDPNVPVVTWAETFTERVKRDWVHRENALAVPGTPEAAAERNRVARGGPQVHPLEVRPALADRSTPEDPSGDRAIEARMLAEQGRLLGLDPMKASPEDLALLGQHAGLAAVHTAILNGGREGGEARIKAIREALKNEALDARKEGRPRSLAKLSSQGITPGGVELVLPATREGQQAYLNGFEDAFVRRPGKPAMAEELLKNPTLSMLSERAHVQGLATVQGLHDIRNISAESLREAQIERMRDALEGISPEVRRDEMNQMLLVMEDARKRHGAAATLREVSTFQKPAALHTFEDCLTVVQAKWARGGEPDLKSFEMTHSVRQKEKVSKEMASLGEYRALRMECRSAMERGQVLEATRLQEQAARVYYREMEAGRVSQEMHQAMRAKAKDPATLMEQIQGVSVEQHQKVVALRQIETLKTQIPAAAQGKGLLYRTPGRFHEDPLPMAAYNHSGQDRLAFMKDGRIQDMALDEVRGDARHPGHALAIRYEAMQKAVSQGHPEQRDWTMARAGFLQVDGPLQASSGPWRGAPGHVGVVRTSDVLA